MIFTNTAGERFQVIEPVTTFPLDGYEAIRGAYCCRVVIRNIFGQREVVAAKMSELSEGEVAA